MKDEIWKEIPDYEGVYQASNLGNIKNKKTNKILKAYENKKNKYLQSHLSKNGIAKVIRSDGKIYNSIKEAKQDIGNVNAHIVEVCQGKLKTTCGYGWNYVKGGDYHRSI